MVSNEHKALLESLLQESQEQTIVSSSTYDQTYPTFSFEMGKRYIMYIPSVEEGIIGTVVSKTVVDEDGNEVTEKVFNPDRPFFHNVKFTSHSGKTYSRRMRCVNGLKNEALGYTGECPLCKVAAENNTLIRKQVEAANPGVELQGKEWAEAASKFRDDQLVTAISGSDPEKSRLRVFPAGFVEVKVSMGKDKKPKFEVTGEPKMYFYQATNYIWKKFEAACDMLTDNPAGYFFSLNFTGNSKLEAGRDVDVRLLQAVPEEIKTLGKQFDKEVLDPEHPWTKDIQAEKVDACRFIPMRDIETKANECLTKVQTQLLALEGADALGGIEPPKAKTAGGNGLTGAEQSAPAGITADDLFAGTDAGEDANATTTTADATAADEAEGEADAMLG